MIARLGGDEFGFIFEAAEASAIDEVCRKALDSCTANFSVHGCEIDLTSSAGFVRSGDHKSRDAVDLIRYADIALYAAKHKDRNHACRFDTEIDETALLENAAQAATKLQTLRGLGFRIALDDFGTGNSAMFNIKNFAIDCIKIDKGFIDDPGNDNQSAAIVASGRKDGQITERGETESHSGDLSLHSAGKRATVRVAIPAAIQAAPETAQAAWRSGRRHSIMAMAGRSC